jgi:hypothetical protein
MEISVVFRGLGPRMNMAPLLMVRSFPSTWTRGFPGQKDGFLNEPDVNCRMRSRRRAFLKEGPPEPPFQETYFAGPLAAAGHKGLHRSTF